MPWRKFLRLLLRKIHLPLQGRLGGRMVSAPTAGVAVMRDRRSPDPDHENGIAVLRRGAFILRAGWRGITPSVDGYTSSTAVRRSPFPSRGRQKHRVCGKSRAGGRGDPPLLLTPHFSFSQNRLSSSRADDIRPYGRVWDCSFTPHSSLLTNNFSLLITNY